MTDPPIRVVVCDDQRVVRDGLVMLVNLVEGIEVVGTAADGAEAAAVAADVDADVVLMDLRMPGVGGVEGTRAVRASSDAAVLVLTTYADDESLFPALGAGATGYLTKDASAEEIEAAIRRVHAGDTWLDPVVQERLVAAVTAPAPPAEPGAVPAEVGAPARPDGLTAREVEVLTLIAAGLSNAEIGDRLYLGRATVKTHINRIFAKTGVRDRAQAVRYAFATGLADPPG